MGFIVGFSDSEKKALSVLDDRNGFLGVGARELYRELLIFFCKPRIDWRYWGTRKNLLNKSISLLIRSFLDFGPSHPQRNYASVRNLPEGKWDFFFKKKYNPVTHQLEKKIEKVTMS